MTTECEVLAQYTPRGYIVCMQQKQTDTIIKRLRRVEGQIQKLQTTIVAETDCEQVITQLLAVQGACASVTREYISQSLAQCVTDKKTAQLERLITHLVKV